MEEARLQASTTKQVHGVQTRNIPDIQKDAEFVMEHLNDPNFDLTQLPSSVVESTNGYAREGGSGAIDELVIF